MTERLLQYIWQFQYFNRSTLTLNTGESFEIIHPGLLNTNQGPDFMAARIKIGRTTLVGPVEIHLKTSLWYKHAHHHDRNYDKVILHVVWENDMEEVVSAIPVFTLQERVSKLLLQQYLHWMDGRWFIPCEQQLVQINPITWLAWKERLLVERLQRKSAIVFEHLERNKQHWEETFWWMLARNFGARVNADAFEAIAQSIPFTILAKRQYQLVELEALLLGQAGLLEKEYTETYTRTLKETYQFQRIKYGLQKITRPLQLLRMRPASFPAVRLAQLAMLIHNSQHLFSKCKEIASLKDIKALLAVTASAFWDEHYSLDKTSPAKPRKLGEDMINNILINTIVPIVFAWGYQRQEQACKDRALQWLSEIPAERNTITEGYVRSGMANTCAFDSQAMLELKNRYCDHKRCLDCAVGNSLLKKKVLSVEKPS